VYKEVHKDDETNKNGDTAEYDPVVQVTVIGKWPFRRGNLMIHPKFSFIVFELKSIRFQTGAVSCSS